MEGVDWWAARETTSSVVGRVVNPEATEAKDAETRRAMRTILICTAGKG